MDTWKIDLIYNWLASAISHEKPKNQHFYFDDSDKTFFSLLEKNNQYLLDEENSFSPEDRDLLLSKINRVTNNDASILEIKKSGKDYTYLFDQTTSYENYTKREAQWATMDAEIKAFLTAHSIDLMKASLIQ